MNTTTSKFRALLSPLAVAAALAAYDSSTTEPAETSATDLALSSASAAVVHTEFPVNVNFSFYSAPGRAGHPVRNRLVVSPHRDQT